MIERTVFQCEHCKAHKRTPRIYFTKKQMEKHEAVCFYNESNRTCLTCRYKVKKENSEGYNIYCSLGKMDYSMCFSFSDCVKRNCEHWELRKEE